MPSLSPTDLAFPPDAYAVHAANIDSDLQAELIVVSRLAAGDAPDKVKLTLLHFSKMGTLEQKQEIDLGNKAALWDTDNALFIQDKDGILRYDGTTPTRIVQQSTPLSLVGPATPIHADFVADINNDKSPDFTIYTGGRVRVFSSQGTELGSAPALNEGRLGASWATGAQSLTVTLLPQACLTTDIDGDGYQDLFLPSHARALLAFGGPQPGSRSTSASLPLDLEPRDTPTRPGQTQREIIGAWVEDINNDKKADLVVERLVSTGSFFGATAEFIIATGTGTGFTSLPTLTTASAAFGVELVDFDNDGDRDLLVPEVDVGMTNLARALVSKAVQVNLKLYRFQGSSYASPTTLRAFSYPFEVQGRFQLDMSQDFDGDGHIDIITNDGEDRIRVYRGTATGLESAAAYDTLLKVPLAENALFVHDLTGDGKAEVLVWGPGEPVAKLLRLP